MLQRVNAFIENQDFCHGQVMWPPLSALQVKLAEPGRSCKQVCQEEQLICEPSFFQHLNKDKDLARFGVDCQTVESSADTVVPAYSETRHHCIFQSDLLLFSCAGAHQSLRRICPCRDYMKGQLLELKHSCSQPEHPSTFRFTSGRRYESRKWGKRGQRGTKETRTPLPDTRPAPPPSTPTPPSTSPPAQI
ncbi:alpha-1,6-mannosylglycoprotein 6-beta-N-acetylglucosaminyltransferase A [Lates japonicus]|uniref:alpha-1,6-mannosyl-glycoprotein 6-beta-N-acetylglucosaminyltransferase n=1 Tax=Lates japonicus TaxID=270547 RepID=A0AAD3NH55_LATJO|nr:alpha-1,6-mannosylglycoprotein 6-beta-N-acetylglucosaminyltransferase A [Lates japonicus]